MIELQVSNPVSSLWHDWFFNFLNDKDLQFKMHDGYLAFRDHVNMNLVDYNATFKLNGKKSVIVFENEQDATMFILKWS